MDTLTVPYKDKGYNVDFMVYEDDGETALPLDGFTVTVKAWVHGKPDDLIIEDVCDNDGDVEGLCHWTLTEQTKVRKLLAELELTVGTTVVRSTKPFILIISESGGEEET